MSYFIAFQQIQNTHNIKTLQLLLILKTVSCRLGWFTSAFQYFGYLCNCNVHPSYRFLISQLCIKHYVCKLTMLLSKQTQKQSSLTIKFRQVFLCPKIHKITFNITWTCWVMTTIAYYTLFMEFSCHMEYTPVTTFCSEYAPISIQLKHHNITSTDLGDFGGEKMNLCFLQPILQQ